MISASEQAPDQRDPVPSRGRQRQRQPRGAVRRALVAGAVGVASLAVTGAGYVVLARPQGGTVLGGDAKPTPSVHATTTSGPRGAMSPPKDELPTAMPGLGPRTRAAIPAVSRQVLVATGKAKDSPDTVVTLWTRTSDGRWKAGAAWPAHNALHGWTTLHQAGDLHSPIGVFTLSDAGGSAPDPGAKLPYDHSATFSAGGVGFHDEPLDRAFDYVIAIDYNRVPGHSPLDGTQPLGPERGGGIWVHVDHGGPTHGCVSVSAAHMVELLRTLTPAAHPVIVMGDRSSLAG